MAALTMSAREQVLFGLNQPSGAAATKPPENTPPPVQGQWNGAPLSLLWSDYVKLAPTVAVAELQQVVVADYQGPTGLRGLFNGTGVATFKSGNTYKGQFEHGRMHGQGTYTWMDGLEYTGGFVRNHITGSGVYTWPSGATYRGDVVDGKRIGQGTMRFANSAVVYTGEWQDSMRHGKGKLTFDKAGKCFYEGAWQHNLKHGAGSMHYSNGNVYTGDWWEDQKHGHGCMQWASGEVYTGQWAQGLQNGIGQHVWVQKQLPSGAGGTNHAFFIMQNRYQGTFENGQRHGYGALYYATGSSYEGEWQQDQKHGNGVFTFEDGTVFDGMFENDRACSKEGQPWGPTSAGLKMRCGDLLENVKDPEAMLNDLSKDLLCVNTELRHVYDVWSKHKAGQVWGETDIPHSMALTGAQMWQMLRVCKVPDPDCPLALINPCLFEACRPAAEIEWLRNELPHALATAVSMTTMEVHSPMRQVLFRDFAEALIRIAHLKYRHQATLQQRLHSLLHNNILPHAQANTSKIWLQQQHTSALHLLFSKTEALQQLFLDIADSEAAASAAVSNDMPAGDDSIEEQEREVDMGAEPIDEDESQPQDETQPEEVAEGEEEQIEAEPDIEEEPYSPKPAWSVAAVSFRGVLSLLQAKGVLGDKLTAEQALAAFHQACYHGCPTEQLLGQARLPSSVPAMDTILNLDNVMIYPEFVEGLARCSTKVGAHNEIVISESALTELMKKLSRA